MEEFENLQVSWELDDTIDSCFISKEDKEIFDKYHLYNKFKLHLHPHPWYGNIKDPEIVVLAINPSYARNSDELDSEVYKEIFISNLQMFNKNRGAYLFNEEINGINNIPFKYSSVSEWWEKVFEEIVTDENGNLKDNDFLNSFNKKVGIFNLIGYHSANSTNLNCNGIKELNTVKNTVKYIEKLMNDEDKIFIFVWGKALWEKIGKLKIPEDTKCFVINDGNYRNKYIKNAKNKKLINIITKIIRSKE